MRRVILLLMLCFSLAACGPRGALVSSTATSIDLRTPTPEDLATAVAPAAESPTPACSSYFTPLGFGADGGSLVGLSGVDGVAGAWLRVLDLQDLSMRTVLSTGELVSVGALSPDGQTVAWALPDYSLQLIDLASGEVTATLTGHTGMVNALVFAPDSSRLFSASSDASVVAWDLRGQADPQIFQPTFSPDGHLSEVLGLGISPDGKMLVTIPLDGSARAWDSQTFERLGEYAGSIGGAYNGARAHFSPDGKYLAIGLSGGPNDSAVWDLAAGQKAWIGGFMSGFAFSPAGRLFAHLELDENGQARTVLLETGSWDLRQVLPPTPGQPAWVLLFSPDGSQLVAGAGYAVHFWQAADGKLLRSYTPTCP